MVFLVQYFLKTVDVFHGDLLGLPESDPGKFETKNGLIKIENMLLKFKFGDITG